jgi:hypothetical protein
MSFSSDVKDELAEVNSTARHCQMAELAAMLSLNGQLLRTQSGDQILVFHTENLAAARKCFTLLKKLFHITAEVSARRSSWMPKSGVYRLEINGEEPLKRLWTGIHMAPLAEKDQWIPGQILLQKDCCRRAFLRGAFLAAGSMSNPEKGYHFEIACTEREKAEQIREVMSSFGIEAHVIPRKKYLVVYIKESEKIVDILGVMSASHALMEMENIRILKGMRESVNRQVNCETANISKTTSAAARQVEDILLIQNKRGLESLPDGLREIAVARLNEPEISLKELGDRLNPPVGKSGVNHRLRKLKELADVLREEE